MQKSPIDQKFEELFRKHSAGGSTPRKLIEAGISREFRLCREEVKKMMERLHLEQEEIKSKRRRTAVNYEQKADYARDLRTFR